MFKNRSQNIECSIGCVANSIVLLKPNVGHILLFNFCEQKFFQYRLITITIDCNGLSLLIFKESVPNSNSFCVRRLFKKFDNFASLHTRQDQNELHLKRWFFFLPKSTSSVGRSIAIFPSVVQAYTQPYWSGVRITVIICQIRHELSVTIHEISTSWNKNVRWRTLCLYMIWQVQT